MLLLSTETSDTFHRVQRVSPKSAIKNKYQGRNGRQGSQGVVLSWILRNRKWRRQRGRTGEVAAAMASLPAKNLPWRPCHSVC